MVSRVRESSTDVVQLPSANDLRPAAIWSAFKTESIAFKLCCLYFLFEYVRPQTRFPEIDILPWTMLTIALAVASSFVQQRRAVVQSSIGPWLIIYLLVACVSLIGAEFAAYGFGKWDSLLPWLLVYYIVTRSVSSKQTMLLLLLVYLLCNLRLSQFGLRTFVASGFTLPGYGFHGPQGWFQNTGELGVQMAMFTPLALLIAYGLWDRFGRLGRFLLVLIPLSALLTTVGTHSRGAIIAVAAATIWALLAIGVRLRNILLVGVLFGLGALLLSDDVIGRFQTMGEDTTSIRRLTFIADGLKIIGDHPVVGIGYFNWLPHYRQYFPPVDDVAYLGTHQLPHNILIQVTAELGFVGLFVFVILVLLSYSVNRRSRQILDDRNSFLRLMTHGLDASMLAFLVAGQFVTILYYPYFWINLALTGGLYAAARNDKVRERKTTVAAANRAVRPKRGAGAVTGSATDVN